MLRKFVLSLLGLFGIAHATQATIEKTEGVVVASTVGAGVELTDKIPNEAVQLIIQLVLGVIALIRLFKKEKPPTVQ